MPPKAGDSFGLDNIGGVLSDGLPGPLVRNGDAGASSSASMSSGGNRSLVISARRLWGVSQDVRSVSNRDRLYTDLRLTLR